MRPLLLLLCLLAQPLSSADRLTLYSGESKVIEVPGQKKRVVGNKDVLDVKVLGDDDLLLNGKNPGQTSLMVWDRLGQKTAYEVEVLATGLKKVMIQVDVQVLELVDAEGWDLGIDWAELVQGRPATIPGAPTGAFDVVETAQSLLSFGTFGRGPLASKLHFLVQNNKAKLLAKPRLMTVSGGSAKFLSGGQIPVVQQDTQSRANVTYKDYGVALEISPKADDDGNINASISAELSNIDPASSVTIGGGVLPAIKTRRVETTFFVKKNGTLVIAGMLMEEMGKVTKGVPILSAIPVLGELFKSTDYRKTTTELVIFVTPRVLGL